MRKGLITRPTLLLDKNKCQANILRMSEKVRRERLKFRPHFKTHQSAEIGSWIREQGVTACTVSSIKMAEYFAHHGWDDILIAFPVNILEAERINELGSALRLQLLVYSKEALLLLQEKISSNVGIKIELDVGNKRSGLKSNQHEEIDELLRAIANSPNFQFTGFYSHPGHTYTSRNKEEVLQKYDEIFGELEMLKVHYEHVLGYSITIGDTPGCTIVEDFGPIEEISPGNFVFYDVMQVNIGSCDYDDIAVVMACPIVGKSEERNEILIHGGAVHFSKEVLEDTDGVSHFGKLANITDSGWQGHIPACYLKSISQEHGIIHASNKFIQDSKIGDLVYIYPAHSCLCADLMKSYLTTDELMMEGDNAFMA